MLPKQAQRVLRDQRRSAQNSADSRARADKPHCRNYLAHIARLDNVHICAKSLGDSDMRFNLNATCRVCGNRFPVVRGDAKTCSSSCRSRLRRGGAFAYLEGLSAKERKAEMAYHDAHDRVVVAVKEAKAAREKVRELKRAARREQALIQVLGRGQLQKLKQEQQRQNMKLRGVVAGVIKHFTQERREISPQAVADFLKMPDAYPLETVASAIEWLKAEGHYDGIVAEAMSSSAGATESSRGGNRSETVLVRLPEAGSDLTAASARLDVAPWRAHAAARTQTPSGPVSRRDG